LWLGNPRSGGMDQFTYGVDAIRPLIGNPEDIARFDLAMAVNKSDVARDEYNKPIETSGELKYTAEACHTLLMWAWTRQPDQIVWSKGAEDEVYKLANDMGSRYVEDPPILQAANARIKIARVAVALAARTFSTDANSEKVIVTKEHVQDAMTFMDMLYEMESFGYAERSRERLQDIKDAEENRDEIRRYLLERRGLAKLLRSNSKFRRQDLEEILNIDREMANGIINKLWEARMIRKEGADNRVEPTLHGLLREVRW
jgi:RPA family protein